MPTKFSFGSQVPEKSTEAKSTSGFMKLEQGDNRLRIMSPTAEYPKHFIKDGYKGACIGSDNKCPGCVAGDKPNIKFMCWVLDRRDGQLKLLELSYGVMKSIAKLQEDIDWAFDDVPMPYDLNIKVDKNSKSPKDYYTVIGSPRRENVSEAEAKEIANQTEIQDVVQAIHEKAVKKLSEATPKLKAGGADSIDYPTEEISPDDIPF
jgi:hypothetical protein